ncbi:MAG: ABC transporter ATP-binding protein, partial [Candidatus Wallbacteria bacterium]|nr:ABC transporter ATP-binding protein [Candidatus Wallbacteria bacterium]
MIRAQGLRKSFGELVALDGIDVEVQAGQIFGLIGPNGAGKTTLIRVLTGLLVPDRGAASLSGYDVLRQEKQARRRLGYMPDFFGIYDHLTVKEYLQLFGELNGLAGRALDEAIEVALAAVRLKLKKDDFVDHLSRGMTQRLALARTLLHDPDVFILDEPASGLDPAARIELWDILRGLADRGKAVLISSHILKEMEGLITHVGLLERGRLLFSGTYETLVRAGSTRRVRFRPVGAVPAERVVGLLTEQGGRLAGVPGDAFWEVELADDDAAVAALVKSLVAAGVGVALPAVAEDRLERAYLALTGRDPS